MNRRAAWVFALRLAAGVVDQAAANADADAWLELSDEDADRCRQELDLIASRLHQQAGRLDHTTPDQGGPS